MEVTDSSARPRDPEPALRAIAMPADANQHGGIFCGWVLSQMGLAGHGGGGYEGDRGHFHLCCRRQRAPAASGAAGRLTGLLLCGHLLCGYVVRGACYSHSWHDIESDGRSITSPSHVMSISSFR